MPFTKQDNARRALLRKIADETLKAIQTGFVLGNISHSLRDRTKASEDRTRYFAPESLLSLWSTNPSLPASPSQPPSIEVSILEISTLDGARYLAAKARHPIKIGVLNFASAKKPGGGFLSGAQAQEESIARSSTLYPTLLTKTSEKFYTLHNHDTKGGYYSHAMIYSPGVLIFRDDDGGWVEPLEVDVLTSPAVNAGVVRKTVHGRLMPEATEGRIKKAMAERMGRVLFLFEKEGVRNIVLGSFGTGVFQNNVEVVAQLWADLLTVPGARFSCSFERVVFAILGRKTFVDFKDAFIAQEQLHKNTISPPLPDAILPGRTQ
jgi:uncharacterized protein (TIGR02452 family)